MARKKAEKYSTRLTAANCSRPVKSQVRDYILWLEEHPDATAYVFSSPKEWGGTQRDVSRREIENWARAIGRKVVRIDPKEYDGPVVDEAERERVREQCVEAAKFFADHVLVIKVGDAVAA